ncbi:hypothetical protein [Jeotgalibacillus sp. R-1-5s-1]|nr:hypothetical protein [Jeotgalibacillus sp. R-1-5s-1]
MYYQDRSLIESKMNDRRKQVEEQRLAKRVKKRKVNKDEMWSIF